MIFQIEQVEGLIEQEEGLIEQQEDLTEQEEGQKEQEEKPIEQQEQLQTWQAGGQIEQVEVKLVLCQPFFSKWYKNITERESLTTKTSPLILWNSC